MHTKEHLEGAPDTHCPWLQGALCMVEHHQTAPNPASGGIRKGSGKHAEFQGVKGVGCLLRRVHSRKEPRLGPRPLRAYNTY